MKATLLIDMPDGVSLDEWYAVKVAVDRLKATEEELMQGIPFDESKTFKFVPLRPLPSKKEIDIETDLSSADDYISGYKDGYNRGVEVGWNKCIDEILGETE